MQTKGDHFLIERQAGTVRYVQFNSLQQFPELIHGAFMRTGGHSPAPYDSLNTSTPPPHLRLGDSIANVVHNRVLALQALTIEDYPCATLWQVHGADVLVYDGSSEWRTDWAHRSFYEHPWQPQMIHKADALVTNIQGAALALSFADCTPLTFYDPTTRVIALAHGGWRGTARGIALATVATMQERFGCQPEHIYAGIGPAIGPCCYEVSAEVHQLFSGEQQFDPMPTAPQYRQLVWESAVFTSVELPDGRNSLRLDLPATNYRQLRLAGLLPSHIENSGICTSCAKKDFFSHRGDAGQSGRFPVIVALT